MKINQRQIILISTKTNGRCVYCGEIGETIDHFFPQKLNNILTPDIENNDIYDLFLSCKKCNCSKNAKFPDDFKENAWELYAKINQKFEKELIGLNIIFTDKFVKQLIDG